MKGKTYLGLGSFGAALLTAGYLHAADTKSYPTNVTAPGPVRIIEEPAHQKPIEDIKKIRNVVEILLGAEALGTASYRGGKFLIDAYETLDVEVDYSDGFKHRGSCIDVCEFEGEDAKKIIIRKDGEVVAKYTPEDLLGAEKLIGYRPRQSEVRIEQAGANIGNANGARGRLVGKFKSENFGTSLDSFTDIRSYGNVDENTESVLLNANGEIGETGIRVAGQADYVRFNQNRADSSQGTSVTSEGLTQVDSEYGDQNVNENFLAFGGKVQKRVHSLEGGYFRLSRDSKDNIAHNTRVSGTVIYPMPPEMGEDVIVPIDEQVDIDTLVKAMQREWGAWGGYKLRLPQLWPKAAEVFGGYREANVKVNQDITTNGEVNSSEQKTSIETYKIGAGFWLPTDAYVDIYTLLGDGTPKGSLIGGNIALAIPIKNYIAGGFAGYDDGDLKGSLIFGWNIDPRPVREYLKKDRINPDLPFSWVTKPYQGEFLDRDNFRAAIEPAIHKKPVALLVELSGREEGRTGGGSIGYRIGVLYDSPINPFLLTANGKNGIRSWKLNDEIIQDENGLAVEWLPGDIVNSIGLEFNRFDYRGKGTNFVGLRASKKF